MYLGFIKVCCVTYEKFMKKAKMNLALTLNHKLLGKIL